MISERNFGKSWTSPSDRELVLRSKLNVGWSVHTGNLFRKIQGIPQEELDTIGNVIRRANKMEKLEVERVGRMLCRLDNMTRNTRGDGIKSCSMCGVDFGFFGSNVQCVDCKKAVCEKCRVDTLTASLELFVLCKICSENREVWKKSGGWFYGKFPTMSEDCQQECISQITGSPGLIRAFDTWEHRAPEIVRLESFEPPEENHNENTLYKDWTTKSTLDLNTLDEEDLDCMELQSLRNSSSTESLRNSSSTESLRNSFSTESLRNSFYNQTKTNMNLLAVQNFQLSSSCPALAELQEPRKLMRKASVRRKRGIFLSGKNLKRIFKSK